MTDSLPSPPASCPASPRLAHDDVHDDDNLASRLDLLLEQYLELLDQYTALRTQLSETFSNGFLSLAHAQRNSNLGAGRRYGQDGYDGRMKALRRVVVVAHTNTKSSVATSGEALRTSAPAGDTEKQQPEYELRVITHEPSNSSSTQRSAAEDGETGSESGTQKVPAQDQGDALEPNQSGNSEPSPRKPKIDPAFRDPATWFSILVPQSLRKAQSSFVTSVSATLPQMLNTVASMEALESQIWALRSKLGTGPNLEPQAVDST